MGSIDKVHAFEEVAKHNHKKDCWLIISGKVYDVTSYLDDHPGGDEVMLMATGRDATNDFEDVGHSDAAREEMLKYYIGDLDSSTLGAETSSNPPPKTTTATKEKFPPKTTTATKETSGTSSKILQFLLPLLILGLAFALRQFTKKE